MSKLIPAIAFILAFAISCAAPEPVIQEVEVTRLVPQTVEVQVVKEVPVEVTRIVEREVEATRIVVEEVPVTVVVTATPQPATHTPMPTSTNIPTPIPDLANTQLANLWIAVYPVDWCAPCIGVSADPAFDVVDFGDLKVIVRAGTRSQTFFNSDPVYGDDGYIQLSQTLDGSLATVTGVSAELGNIGSLRCEKHSASTPQEFAYACVWR